MDKVNSFLGKCINVIFAIVALWILIIVGIVSVKKYTIVFLLSFCFILLIFNYLQKIYDEKIVKRLTRKRFQLLLVISFFIMLLIAFSLRVDVYDTWDYGQLVRTAYEEVVDGTIRNKAYYARYSNNSMFLMLLVNYFKIVHFWAGENLYRYIYATIPLNCILVVLSIWFTYLTVCELWGERQGGKVGCVMLSLSPLYAYAAIAYTDIFAIFPVALILFCYSRAKKKNSYEKKIWICFTAVIATVGYKLKATLIIIIIAIIMDLFFGFLQKRVHFLDLTIFLAVCIISFITVSSLNNSFLNQEGITEEMRYEEGFPVTHWIMMSLNAENSGGYVQADVDYTNSIKGKEAKEKANMEIIQERLHKRSCQENLCYILGEKVGRMWGEGEYNVSNYVSRKPLSNNIIRSIFSMDGKYNLIYLFVTQLCHIYILFTITFFGLKCNAKKNDQEYFFFKIILIGVFFFFLIWECNSRYLLVFLPAICILAVRGNDLLYVKIQKNMNRSKNKKKGNMVF